MLKRILRIVSGAAVAVGVIGVLFLLNKKSVSQNQNREQTETIKIGIAAPLTGGVSYQGERFIRGAEMAAEENNNLNSNKKIELIIEDDKCSANEAAPIANKLINLDNLRNIVSYCGASSSPYIEQIRDKNGIVLVSSVRMENSEGKDPFVLNLLPSPEKEMSILADYMKDKGINRVAVIYQQDFFGETYRSKFYKAYGKVNGIILFEEGYQSNAANDFRTSLSKIKNSDAEGIVNFVAHAGNYSVLLKQAEEMDIELPFFSEWIAENPDLIKLAGELSNGIIYTHPFKEDDSDKYYDFAKKYIQKYNQEPNIDSVNGYIVVNLFASLREDCGLDSSCYLRHLNLGDSYSSILGDVKFSDFMREGEIFIKTVKESKFVLVEK